MNSFSGSRKLSFFEKNQKTKASGLLPWSNRHTAKERILRKGVLDGLRNRCMIQEFTPVPGSNPGRIGAAVPSSISSCSRGHLHVPGQTSVLRDLFP